MNELKEKFTKKFECGCGQLSGEPHIKAGWSIENIWQFIIENFVPKSELEASKLAVVNLQTKVLEQDDLQSRYDALCETTAKQQVEYGRELSGLRKQLAAGKENNIIPPTNDKQALWDIRIENSNLRKQIKDLQLKLSIEEHANNAYRLTVDELTKQLEEAQKENKIEQTR